MNLLERLTGQLDTLVSFLALGHEEVFDLLRTHEDAWFESGAAGAMPVSYDDFQAQLAHGTFLLGYSYFEAFAADLTREIYRARPSLLPRDKQLRYGDILAKPKRPNVIELMIEREVCDLFYKSITDVASHYSQRFSIVWPRVEDITEASLVRNCILHNGARVDDRLATAVSRFEQGASIVWRSATSIHTA